MGERRPPSSGSTSSACVGAPAGTVVPAGVIRRESGNGDGGAGGLADVAGFVFRGDAELVRTAARACPRRPVVPPVDLLDTVRLRRHTLRPLVDDDARRDAAGVVVDAEAKVERLPGAPAGRQRVTGRDLN